ncbi:MAG: hypothetical protein ACLTTU_13015 [Bilophila wadsworthia]
MDTYEKRNLLEKSYQSAVHEAWKQFIANKPIREKDIPPHILRSWKLSREASMDPLNPQVPPVLNSGNWRACAASTSAHRLAKPILDMLKSRSRHRVHRHPAVAWACARRDDDNRLCRRGATTSPARRGASRPLGRRRCP